MTIFDRYSLVSYRVFRLPAGRIAKAVPVLKDDLLKSDLRVTPVGLVAVALMSTLLAGVMTAVLVVWAAFARLPFLFLIGIAPLVMFLLVLNSPRFSKSSRASALENELPFVVGFMSILAGGGLSLMETLRQISGLNIFPAASREARRILIDAEVFGHDPITALDRAAKYSPSRGWGELLSGYTTVLRTGGDYVNYLNLHLKDSFEALAERIKRTVETVGLVSESFLIVAVVLGMTLFTLYLVEALVNGNPAGITNVFIFAFVVVPLLSAAFVWLTDAVSPKWPYIDTKAYKVFAVCFPLGVILFLIPLPVKLYLHVSLSLLVISAAPAFVATKRSRERRMIERMLPEFIKDVAEGRKIGLPPEESIERTGETNNYSALSKHVNKMAAQLSWGVSLTKVIAAFSREVNSWIAKAIGTLMLEVVEIGGATLRGFDEMAVFTNRVSIMESDKRSSLRPFVLVAYVGGLMLLVTTFMMVYILYQEPKLVIRGAPALIAAANPNSIDSLLTAGIFQCWTIGIVAGKMGEGSVADGFKHASALVVLSLVAVLVARGLIGFPI
jgi:flagellar protein FlaJ